MYAQDSIDLLKEAGLDFARHEASGIDVQYFGELMVTSGLVQEHNGTRSGRCWCLIRSPRKLECCPLTPNTHLF
jgi:hypothetical protein